MANTNLHNNTISESICINQEIKSLIKSLEKEELSIRDIPDEFALDSNIVKTERKLGLRKSGHRGFDVITQTFFVEENWICKKRSVHLDPEFHKITFESFEKYYKFLDGDIYENACYYQYTFKDEFSKNLKLDMDRLTKVKNFVTETVDDCLNEMLQDGNVNLDYKIRKIYDKGKFYVRQSLHDKTGKCVKWRKHIFLYFFDFVGFLKGDLSSADLVFCTGMRNLPCACGIDLNNAKMTSELCDKFNIPYELYDYDKSLIDEFPIIEKNEEETALVVQTSREVTSYNNSMFFGNINRVSYISDLHLMHRIQNAKCKSIEDIIYIMQKIIDNILAESARLTLIGGDTSANFAIFELFIIMLRRSMALSCEKRDFVFVLGNHELWGFAGMSLKKIIDKYRLVLKRNGMYLLHNDLLYRNDYDNMEVIPYDELVQLDNSIISGKLRCARLMILGGLGFSGYNEEFNANNGVYRETVDRNTEIQESKKFEQLYNKLTDVLAKKNTVIFTHTPKKDWCANINYHDNFVYVNGHTHRNMFFDDGVKRIYADNQIGYRNENLHLKYFLINGEYDYFEDYKDGIYEITPQEYQDFYRGKNIRMTFNRQVNILYMLKKNGYYCFVHKAKTGSLTILNGGALKRLGTKDVQYYYDNMNTMIASIETPLKKYTAYQESIANEIKKIGGDGYIHGCIIDIDFWNHVYVNPVDLTVRSYWASDIINKYVYPTMSALLKANCPELYANYLKLETEEKLDLLIKGQKNKIETLPQEYLETDIYKASREIMKMQKLKSNILTTWYNTGSGEPLCKLAQSE